MLKDLIKVANKLDQVGLTKEADYLDELITKLAQEEANPATHDNYYRQVLEGVSDRINAKHSGIRARTGREDGTISIIVGGTTKGDKVSVVDNKEVGYSSAYPSESEFYSDLQKILEEEKASYQARTGIDVSDLKLKPPYKLRYEDLDHDDSAPEGDYPGLKPSYTDAYQVYVVKSNVENTMGERFKRMFRDEEGTEFTRSDSTKEEIE